MPCHIALMGFTGAFMLVLCSFAKIDASSKMISYHYKEFTQHGVKLNYNGTCEKKSFTTYYVEDLHLSHWIPAVWCRIKLPIFFFLYDNKQEACYLVSLSNLGSNLKLIYNLFLDTFEPKMALKITVTKISPEGIILRCENNNEH